MKATDWVEQSLEQLRTDGLLRDPSTRSSPQSNRIELDGTTLINFGSNDYLGLANELGELLTKSQSCGWGSGASPLITGRSTMHVELQRQLADFEEQPAALLFTSGYAANVGTIASLIGRGHTVFSDAKNHASIIDGCRLSRADVRVFRHNDVDHLRELLAASQPTRRLIVTDGLFSMDGDMAPLVEYAQLAEEFDAMLLVDEAHATGVFGDNGRGTCEHLGVEDGVTVRVGTLSKALGSIGGFVSASESLVEWIANAARSYFFSTAPPATVCAQGLAGLKIAREQPHRRRELLELAGNLRDQLAVMNFDLGPSCSQIIPIYMGEPERAMAAADRLRDCSVYAPGIRPPTVPKGESMLRISLSWSHTQEDVEELLSALRQL